MASVSVALGQASANYGWVAARPNGLILTVLKQGAINRINPAGETRWVANLIDICADDWQAGPLETVRAALAASNGSAGEAA